MQLVEDAGLLPPLQATPARLPGTEPQLQRQQLPGNVVVEGIQDALQTEPVRHRPWPWRPLGPGRQQRLDQRPQVIVHDPRPSIHTITNGRTVTPVTPDQGISTRSCYELCGAITSRICMGSGRRGIWVAKFFESSIGDNSPPYREPLGSSDPANDQIRLAWRVRRVVSVIPGCLKPGQMAAVVRLCEGRVRVRTGLPDLTHTVGLPEASSFWLRIYLWHVQASRCWTSVCVVTIYILYAYAKGVEVIVLRAPPCDE